MMTPQTEDALAEMVKQATGPLRIQGGGTRAYGRATGDLLDMRAMAGISLYEPGALTIVAQAGTPLKVIEDTLAAENQRLAFEPMDHRKLLGTTGEPTIGGVVAANVSGPRRISVGACRDFLLGVRFVDGSGAIIKNGGRVMKNVTGYDLVKLLAGSYGTLGVLTEVALKVLPDVASQTTLVLDGLDDARAVSAMSAALSSPFEVTGVAHDPAASKTRFRLEGFAASVSYRAEALAKVLSPFGSATQETDADWAAIRDVAAFADKTGDVWRISVKPSDAPALVAKMGAKAVQYDWGGGLIWALTDGGDLRKRMGSFAGHATLIRGTADVPTFQPEPAAIAAITAGLRAKFDPRGILNTGMMG